MNNTPIQSPPPATVTVEIGEVGAVFQIEADATTGIPALVAQFKNADVPHANPPEAEAVPVLETQTAPEVAGEPEPLTDEQKGEIVKATELEKFNEERVARGEKPLKRMPPERKTRRTAPVVQVELDAAEVIIARQVISITEQNEEITRLETRFLDDAAEIAALKRNGAVDSFERKREANTEVRERHTDEITELNDTITALRVNEARAAERFETLEHNAHMIQKENARLTQELDDRALTNPERSTPMEILVDECEARGWKVTLSR